MRPLLVVTLGNPDRGDDAIGPLLARRLRAALRAGAARSRVEILEACPLQVEHCLDLRGRERVVFVDAASGQQAPVRFERVAPSGAAPAFTHALEPAALLGVYRRVVGEAPPPAWALTVRGTSFGPGEPLGDDARECLEAAWSVLSGELSLG